MRACTICNHPERVALEAAVLAGTSIRSTAKSAGISWSALRRHLQHVAEVATQRVETEEKAAKANGSLRGRVEEIIGNMRRIATAAEKAGNFNAALAGLRAQLQCLEMLGKLSGELRPGGPGEFVPGTGVTAAASVTLNLPAEAPKDPARFVQLLREIYGLPAGYARARGEDEPETPIM